VTKVVLGSGYEIDADLVVFGGGCHLNTGFAESAGIVMDRIN